MKEDKEIIDLFFQRSEEAVEEVDRKYGGICRRLAYQLVNSWEDAEECVNDAWLGAWNAIPPARPDPLLTYLCRIVRNISLNRWRQKGAARRGGYGVALEEIEGCLGDGNTPERALEARELAKLIEAFLDTLTEENRIIFLRRYWFADGCREIGERVRLGEKAVSVRLSRLRKKLRNYLEERGAL